jgi:hypothetical protein
MFEVLESPDNVLALKVVGKIEKPDYVTVLEPAVQKMLANHAELRAVIVLGAAFDGLTLGAGWEDTKFGMAHLSKWKKCAVVSDKDWVHHSLAVFGWMMPGDLKLFAESDLDAAIAWAAQ